jgi:ribosomal protein S18 acetylase RimI-like enzyme
MLVQQLSHTLLKEPEVIPVKGFAIRHFKGDTDIIHWVKLMNRAFQDLNPPMRHWTEADFKARFTQRSGWSPGDLFFASNQKKQVVGSVSVSFRQKGKERMPAVHFLAVRPQWRRQGIARLLVASLESAMWARGFREIFLETHAGWDEAIRFYKAIGYQPNALATKLATK